MKPYALSTPSRPVSAPSGQLDAAPYTVDASLLAATDVLLFVLVGGGERRAVERARRLVARVHRDDPRAGGEVVRRRVRARRGGEHATRDDDAHDDGPLHAELPEFVLPECVELW